MNGRVHDVTNVLRLLGAFVTLSMLAGLLAAGLAIPAVGATGSAAKGGVAIFDDLPSQLTQNQLNQQSRILDAGGNVIATPYAENRIIVPLSSVAPIMRKAQVAIEDSRFYEHGGLDVRGISRALVSTLQGNKQGASTLTQQYVKLTLQENALRNDDEEAAKRATARNGVEGVTRKLQELKYAVNLEKNFTKDEILEGYMNLSYYGDQAYGVEAASQHYFSIPASKLNYVQAALLAGTVQQPGRTDPVNFPTEAFERRNVVLDRMAELGIITAKQAADGKKVTIKSMLKVKPAQNTCQRATQPYFCEYVMAWLKTQKSLGKDVAERLKNINTQGLTIQTTLKPGLSEDITKILTKTVPIGTPKVGAAASVIEPGTGKVLGMGQTSVFTKTGKYKANEVNWNVDHVYGSNNGQQFGSTAKLFALVTALESGMPVDSSIYAKFAGPHRAAIYTSADNSDNCSWVGPWPVRNDWDDGGKTIPLRRATAASVNTAFASLTLKLGECKVQATMTKMGLHRADGSPIQKLPAPITLGADEVSPLTLANAYATVASGGVRCDPIPVVSVTTPDKKAIKIDGANCKRVLDPDVAAGATELLKGVTKPGGTAPGIALAGGRPGVGKTGTTDSHVETWFAGFTPQLSTAVWVGTPDSQSNLGKLAINGRVSYNGVFGATYAAPLWKKVMDRASEGLPIEQFRKASDKIVKGDFASIPSVAGMSYDAAKTAIENAGFSAFNAGRSNSTVPAGLVAGTDPSGRALKGSAVGIYISTGYVPPPVVQTPKPEKTATPTGTTQPPPTSTKPKPKKTPPPKST